MTQVSASDIAVIGMAGRFPGAADVDQFWDRTVAGEDCLVAVDTDAIIAAGADPDAVHDPAYVARFGALDDVAGFDHEFFGIGARDAAVMDPQHRHFLECAWEALESATIVPEQFDGAIGVFGGCGANTYLMRHLLANQRIVEQLGWFLLRHTGNDKDFFTNNVAYHLGLTGPAINVQTACSTSLVATHLATQSLLGHECDVALAGGATIDVPFDHGYQYREGEILAPDGRCRAFDERSAGTVLTSGVGVVVLRRLTDALDDGDPVLAIIKSTAVNNDGARKVSFLAPSVDGHAEVVREALSVADLSARDIQLLEAHGTGTPVGDPIEVAALTEAFRTFTPDTGFCRLTSSKPNVGHLDTAAGVTSLIKVVQALQHKMLPPLANHTGPSPLLDLASTPFTLSSKPSEWPATQIRRAGVSSLGVGGTNAHVIVQEAPALPERTAPLIPEHLLLFSGRTSEAALRSATRLADHPSLAGPSALADVAHTLIAGRRQMQHRVAVTTTDAASAPDHLRGSDRQRRHQGSSIQPAYTGFAFPGGGSFSPGMGSGLDARFEVFHDTRREIIELVAATGGTDLGAVLQPQTASESFAEPTVSLPAVFATSVAIARQWQAFGVCPDFLLGHSLGEYAAAHLAGVLSLTDAVELVVRRSELMQRATGDGFAMLIVPAGVQQVTAMLPDDLSLAVVNAADECVVSGPGAAIDRFALQFSDDEIAPRRVGLAAAAHCAELDSVMPEFLEIVKQVALRPPSTKMLSNVTGEWLTPEQATSAQYWVDHLRSTVQFADCLDAAINSTPPDHQFVLTEVGPGQALSGYARRAGGSRVTAIPTLRHPQQDICDTAHGLQALGKLWTQGLDVDVARLTHWPAARRVRLPTYPFDHQQCWIEPDTVSAPARHRPDVDEPDGPDNPDDQWPRRLTSIDAMSMSPVWRAAPDQTPAPRNDQRWAVIAPLDESLSSSIVEALEGAGRSVTHHDTILSLDDDVCGVVVVAPPDSAHDAVERWLEAVPALFRQLTRFSGPTRLVAVTRGAVSVGDADVATHPHDALALGPILVAPGEYEGLSTLLLDLDEGGLPERAAADLLGRGPQIIAVRDGVALTPEIATIADQLPPTSSPAFRTGGTYLVTGGLGGIGHQIALHLARTYSARVAVTTSAPLPAVDERSGWLASHGSADPTSQRLRRLDELDATGADITVVTCDVSAHDQIVTALDDVEALFGPVDGVIHAAGVVDDQLIETMEMATTRAVVDPKAGGALFLVDELGRRGIDSLLLISSTSTLIGPPGQTSYVAANAVLDSMAGTRNGVVVQTIDFGVWANVGIASRLGERARLGLAGGNPVEHPVLSERIDAVNSVAFVGELQAATDWVVSDHRSADGTAILPGTGHLDLLMFAARTIHGSDRSLEDVTLYEPVVVEHTTVVRITVTRGAEPSVQLESASPLDGRWTLHSECRVVPPPTRVMLSIDGPGWTGTLTAGDPLATQRQHLHLGPRWEAHTALHVDDHSARANIRLPERAAEDPELWTLHPAIADIATAVGVLLASDDRLHVPVRYRTVTQWHPLPADVIVEARRQEASTGGRLLVDLSVWDPSGRPLLEIEEVELVAVDPNQLGSRPNGTGSEAKRAHSLAELATHFGLSISEGLELIETMVASRLPRMIASSVAIEDLRRFVHADESPAPKTAASVAPMHTSLESILRAMFKELLGCDEVADDDDFFDLGGHSLIAIRLMARIQRELGVRLALSSVFEGSTVTALSILVRAERPDVDALVAGVADSDEDVTSQSTSQSASLQSAQDRQQWRSLVPISTSGTQQPIYIVHGAGGNVLFLWSLARALGADRPLYGFQAMGINHGDLPDGSIEEMAARYVAELRAHTPGPYLLGGFSGGGLVTLEMVRQLHEAGEEVDHVVLFDSVPPGCAAPGRAVRTARFLRHLIRVGPGPLQPFLRSSVGDLLSRVHIRKLQRNLQIEQYERELGYDVESHGVVNLYFYFSATADRYEAVEYETDVTVFVADRVWPIQPADYHWSNHVNGALRTTRVPGNHHSMFYPENAPALAAALTEALSSGAASR